MRRKTHTSNQVCWHLRQCEHQTEPPQVPLGQGTGEENPSHPRERLRREGRLGGFPPSNPHRALTFPLSS